MTAKQKARVQALARKLEWRKVKSKVYKSCPHEYASMKDHRRTWTALALMIKAHGRSHEWRGSRFRYLIAGRFCYWWMGPIINRSYRQALDNGGYPAKKWRKAIKKRFWGGN